MLNIDEYSQEVIPDASRSLAPKGSHSVQLQTYGDKRNISGCLCITAGGRFYKPQLICKGKTPRSFPKYRPLCVHMSLKYDKSWANTATVSFYTLRTSEPVTVSTRCFILDVFKPYLDEYVLSLLSDHNVISVFVPAGMTGQLQPLNVDINKLWKDSNRRQFIECQSKQVFKQKSCGIAMKEIKVDTRWSVMKTVHIRWIKHTLGEISQTDMCQKAFHKALAMAESEFNEAVNTSMIQELEKDDEDDDESDQYGVDSDSAYNSAHMTSSESESDDLIDDDSDDDQRSEHEREQEHKEQDKHEHKKQEQPKQKHGNV